MRADRGAEDLVGHADAASVKTAAE
ncbi:uncharacterized protein ARMOST_21805 [Armillaria ostoyae]|uniref:Uncharacterized protein n=1 Tax=Armillaria ostoyae TaxID=47428 RepID=A0A284SB36_ARMOS|nr:uncharacterized protein ARMOST_21805 [Armillaria ostoyae]